ncbi:hypothetical protein O3P69_002507 [Scylla paramamosain]|uniref:Uncharacterized protein n=1 Tax=Scylla paramamosain TaxID=85552 RepID=A0AAW0UKU8_SCYPA
MITGAHSGNSPIDYFIKIDYMREPYEDRTVPMGADCIPGSCPGDWHACSTWGASWQGRLAPVRCTAANLCGHRRFPPGILTPAARHATAGRPLPEYCYFTGAPCLKSALDGRSDSWVGLGPDTTAVSFLSLSFLLH